MKYFILFAVCTQIVLFIAVFDIYFTSPIIHGVEPVENTIGTASSRVVFISVDGLRLDALLENPIEPIAPFIRSIMATKAAWGVSNTHLPTESRPGHVALLAGFYEDPSAVTKGWKENPVDFDSIFNRSRCSFSWGSPDIVNIFHKGLQHKCSRKWTYEDNQDFAGNPMESDNWVLKKVQEFFETSAESSKLYSQENTLFFLHLLGQDTSGHTHKPKTELYRNNLRNVDKIVRQVDSLFRERFNDNKTTFILTADHGMTDWGSHGAGDPTETLTPIVAWGAGITKNKNISIEQADVTPLLAILLGVSIPVNSVGNLPTEFLNSSKLYIAQARLLHARQISALYLGKRNNIESKSLYFAYKSFKTLDQKIISSKVMSIEQDLRKGDVKSSLVKIDDLLKVAMEGIKFYETYFQKPLFVASTISYISWLLFLVLMLHGVRLKLSVANSIFLCLLVIITNVALAKAQLPLTYHAHATLPILLVFLISGNISFFVSMIAKVFALKQALYLTFLFLSIELCVYGFFHRWVYCICIVCVVFWPFTEKTYKNKRTLMLWILSGLSLGSFVLYPVVGKVPHPILVLASAVLIGLSSALITKGCTSTSMNVLRFISIIAAGINSSYAHSAFLSTNVLPAIPQQISWLLLLSTPIFLLVPSQSVIKKFSISLCYLAAPFLLLSIAHEGFFLFSLFIHVGCWVKLEMDVNYVIDDNLFVRSCTRRQIHDEVGIPDFRRAFFFLLYIIVGFFGIGNLATLNSFDPAWVRCFLTTFSPFVMTALILLKVIIPFLGVSLALRAITVVLDIRPYRIFLCVLIYCNLMALNFLFLVRNEGSWLDIGTSLSHYVIQQLTIVFILLLFSVAQLIIPSYEASAIQSSRKLF